MHSEPNETNAAVDPAAVERVRERRTELAPALGRTWTDGPVALPHRPHRDREPDGR